MKGILFAVVWGGVLSLLNVKLTKNPDVPSGCTVVPTVERLNTTTFEVTCYGQVRLEAHADTLFVRRTLTPK